jgi:BirA family biotin operon repressor/biotin-[acetyl-CoA-carboxylase] ligase
MIATTLIRVLNDGEFHSKEELSCVLGSQSELLREIEALRALGCEIDHDDARGYCLPPGIKYLDSELILNTLESGIRDKIETFEVHLTIDSTSSEALRKINAGHQGRAVIVAEHQGQGRGRRGRVWVSPMARNLYLSVIWPFEVQLHNLSGLSLVIALSLVKVLQSSGLNGMENLAVKWPNDVLLNGLKLAGILLELNSQNERLHQVIIGIGLNVSMPEEALVAIDQRITDVASHDNHDIDRNRILTCLLAQLDQDLTRFGQSGFAHFRQQWQQIDHFRNQPVEVITGQQRMTGIAKGVDDSGALILETEMGQKTLHGGELAPTLRRLNTNPPKEIQT